MPRGERIVTVQGEISPKTLGVTLTHEHLLVDSSFYIDFYGLPKEKWKRKVLGQPLKMKNLWMARRELFSFKDNLVIKDDALITSELKFFSGMGGRSLVDLTPPSLGGSPGVSKRISAKSGLNVVYGCGFYIEPSHPPEAINATSFEMAKDFTRLIEHGYDDTGIRAGILGEIGTSPVITSQEHKVLRAVAATHRKTGAPINIHLANIRGSNGPKVAELMKEEGVRMDKVTLSHVDMKYRDPEQQFAMANFGVFLGFDGFGFEDYVERLDFAPPRDRERIDNIVSLIDKGFLDQILVSQDICRKTSYMKYGGQGFGHLMRNVVPMMKKAGISDKEIENILVDNPRRFLAF